MHGEQRSVTRKRCLTTMSQTGSPGPLPPIPHAFLNGTMWHSRHYQESFRLSNSHRFARWEPVPYYLGLVRTGPFRLSEILRLSPTRPTCSRLNARFDAANRRISPRAASVHLASSHRLLRGQKISIRPGVLQHFRLFSLCSAGRDTGNLQFETETVRLHIGFFLGAFKKFLGSKTHLRVAISDFRSEAPRPVVQSNVVDKLRSSYKGVRIGFDQDRKQGRGYHGELCFRIFATPSARREQELVDGGDVKWTQKLLNNAKERLVISGCGSERVCELSGRRAPDEIQ